MAKAELTADEIAAGEQTEAQEQLADEQAAVAAAVAAPAPAKRSRGEAAAERAEIRRQEEVVGAVAKAHDTELPKLGGAILEPGLGR